jgi:hypothetical protein
VKFGGGAIGRIAAAQRRDVSLNGGSHSVRQTPGFTSTINSFCDLSTRPLGPDEVVLCIDEMTSLQPRPRKSQTLPTGKDRPTQVEHEFGWCGALNLLAAIDTRTGKVPGTTASRKRQSEFIAFLEQLDGEVPESVTTLHVVLDNVRMR